MNLSRALAVLQGAANPTERPDEYAEAERVVVAGLGEIEATLRRMGYTPDQAHAWTEQLRQHLS